MSDPHAAVVLIGAPGAGKTRTGKRLARLLDLPLIDTDARVVAAHGPIATIFDELGETQFRTWEREAVSEALRQHAIVTLGGGAVLDAATQADLEALPVVQLTISPAVVEQRIAGGKRPLLRDGIGAWQSIVDARQPLYDRLSSLTIDTSHLPLDNVAERIVGWLETRP